MSRCARALLRACLAAIDSRNDCVSLIAAARLPRALSHCLRLLVVSNAIGDTTDARERGLVCTSVWDARQHT